MEYYGAVLGFIGTTSLGVITIYQNHLAQVKSDEVNTLTLELAKRNSELAEQAYHQQHEIENEKLTPKLELKNFGSNGHYMKLIQSS